MYLLLKALAGGDGDEHVHAFAQQILGLLHHVVGVALIFVIIDDPPIRLARLHLDVHDACLRAFSEILKSQCPSTFTI